MTVRYEPLPAEVDAQITYALNAYCRGVDRRDWDLVRTAFHRDARDNHGRFSGSVDVMIEWMQSRHPRISMSMHFLGNSMRQRLDDSSIAVETYCIAFQSVEAAVAREVIGIAEEHWPELDAITDPVQSQVRCRYLDVFSECEGVWRISRRKVVYESRQLEIGAPIPPGTGGSRDENDPSFSHFGD